MPIPFRISCPIWIRPLKHCFIFALVGSLTPIITSTLKAAERDSALRRDIARAKAEGKHEIKFVPPARLPTGIDTVSDVTNEYTVVIAEPLTKTTTESPQNDVATWYSLKIDEVISRQEKIPDSLATGEPPSLLIRSPNDVVLPVSGGTMSIDDVTVTEVGIDLKMGSKYLLFLYVTGKGTVGQLASPQAVFAVSSDESLTPLSSSRLASDVKSRFPEGLKGVRDYFVSRSRQ